MRRKQMTLTLKPSAQTLKNPSPSHSARTQTRNLEEIYAQPIKNKPWEDKITFYYFSAPSRPSCFTKQQPENTPDNEIFIEIKTLHRWIHAADSSPEHTTIKREVLNAINQTILEIQHALNVNGHIHGHVLESLNRYLENIFTVAQITHTDGSTLDVADFTLELINFAQHQEHHTILEDYTKSSFLTVNKTESIKSIIRYFTPLSRELARSLINFDIGNLHYYKLNVDRDKLKDQNLKNAILKWAYLPSLINLSNLNLSYGRLDFSIISGSNFSDTKCIRTSFIEATAINTIFIGADLTDADWTGGNFTDVNVTGAKLKGLILTDTIITGIRSEDDNLIRYFIESNTLEGENRRIIFMEAISFIERTAAYDVNDIEKQRILFGPLYRNAEQNTGWNFLNRVFSLENSAEPTFLGKILSLENLAEQENFLNLFFNTLIYKGLNV